MTEQQIEKKIEKAATLLLVRDAAAGLEVFMLERPSRGAFPGLHVFTGGKVDATDEGLVESIHCRGPSYEAARDLLDVTDTPRSYWLAAVRECFEESGVLLGRHRDRQASVAEESAGLNAATLAELARCRAEDFATLCNRLELTLELDQLHYFAHWVTPEQAPRRFDTRFFVAAMPAGQTAIHAPGETVSGEWTTPADALARGESGHWNLIMPTLTSLRSLLGYNSVAELLGAVQRFEHLPEYSDYLGTEGMQPGINPAHRARS